MPTSFPRASRLALPPAVVLALTLGAAVSSAAETQWWILDRAADHAKSESRGIVVGPDGTLGLGPAASASRAESLQVIWAVQPLPDGSVAIAGDRGRIERWTASAGVRPWIRLPVGHVLALAWADGALVAGTAPEGLVYRIGANGDTALLARTGERYVWGLAPAGKGAWWAATGTRGRLQKIAGGRIETVLDTDESNLVSLLADGRGGVFAGGDSKGRVVHVAAGGAARTVLDAAEDEVRSLALGPDGALYAAALSATAVSTEDGGERVEPVRAAVSGGRAVVYRVVPDSVSWTAWTSPQPFVFALLGRPDGVLAATGNRAAVYQLTPAGASQWLHVPEGQITALAAGADGRVWAACSNPGTLWRLGPDRAGSGELLSPVFDARRIARFGAVRWQGSAGGSKLELETRSGNSDPPDTTWSRWTGGTAGPEGVRSAAPAARYFQWKLRASGGAPRIESVETAWREQNQPPRIDELTIAPQGGGFREGEMTPRLEPVTQTLPGGQKIEYSIPNPGTPAALRALPAWARGLRTIQWRGTDPNGDPLRYRVDVAREASSEWIEVGKDLETSAFTWDTNGLPDGRFRVRVQASDAPGNAVGEERVAETLSEAFTVDNTPPAVAALDAKAEGLAIAVSGRAEDATSPIGRIEVSLDDDDWRTVAPEGGLADQRTLAFRVRLPLERAGEHTVAIRVADLAGNVAQRAAHVSVPRTR